MIVGISYSLVSTWGLNTNDLRKVLFEFGKRHIETMTSEGVIAEQTELQLTTFNSPSKCPFDPNRIDIVLDKAFKFQMPQDNPVAEASTSSLAFQIIDLRDSVNAIFGGRFGDRLLVLPQERHLVELFKSCGSPEEFAYRVASLGGLTTAINTASLKKTILRVNNKSNGNIIKKKDDPKNLKSLDMLGIFLRNRHAGENVNTVMDCFRGFNWLRRMYPIHTDRATGVLDAFKYFGIDYPVTDFQKAWKRLLEKYRDTLQSLLIALKAND
jgi:hypothetical protein